MSVLWLLRLVWLVMNLSRAGKKVVFRTELFMFSRFTMPRNYIFSML